MVTINCFGGPFTILVNWQEGGETPAPIFVTKASATPPPEKASSGLAVGKLVDSVKPVT